MRQCDLFGAAHLEHDYQIPDKPPLQQQPVTDCDDRRRFYRRWIRTGDDLRDVARVLELTPHEITQWLRGRPMHDLHHCEADTKRTLSRLYRYLTGRLRP